jgi:tRNA(Phe) wybutosine-synthesizing methylase Tyw3
MERTWDEDGRWKRIHNNFCNSKNQCLGKRDKSSAGRLDAGAVEICAVLNELDAYYTTSSCAGRCFLYTGEGIKATDTFRRCRVAHSRIRDPDRYFDLSTLSSDPTGGGDPIIHEYDGGRRQRQRDNDANITAAVEDDGDPKNLYDGVVSDDHNTSVDTSGDNCLNRMNHGTVWWLRYEPFILHVACRSLEAAATLMATARPMFKNVGLTTFSDAKFLVAI